MSDTVKLQLPCEHGALADHALAECWRDHDESHLFTDQCWCPGGAIVMTDPTTIVKMIVSAAPFESRPDAIWKDVSERLLAAAFTPPGEPG